jgi:predicted methyltransferase
MNAAARPMLSWRWEEEPPMRAEKILAAMMMLALFTASPAARAQTPNNYSAVLAQPDRSAADRDNDTRRKPLQILELSGVKPGMKVLDMGAGAGYSSELFARAVGPTGTVYAQNGPKVYARVGPRIEARLKTPGAHNIVNDVRPYDDPVPPGVSNLDLVTFFYFYHDTTYLPVDRAKMDRALFAALKPGGVLLVADYAAAPGKGTSEGHTLHRIEEATLEHEVEAAGFKKVAEGNFLRNPNDPRTEPIFHPKQPVDIFVLKFEKPD